MGLGERGSADMTRIKTKAEEKQAEIPVKPKMRAPKQPAKRKPGGTKGKGTRDGSKRAPTLSPEALTMQEHMTSLFTERFLVGKPRMYQTPKAMVEAISLYFQQVVDAEAHPTITGLSLSLGFNSLQALRNYEGYGTEFHSIIKYAKHLIEHAYEVSINTKSNPMGSIFVLKNLKSGEWNEKIQTEISGGMTNIDMTPTERHARLETLMAQAKQRQLSQEEDNDAET